MRVIFMSVMGEPVSTPRMPPLLQMGQYKPLPVPVQHILRAVGGEHQTAAPGQRLQQQMHLRVVAQGLKVSHALRGAAYRLPVHDPAGIEIHGNAEALLNEAFQYLHLHPAHELDVYFPQRLVPHHPQHGILVLQLTQLWAA
jgi:hypothetical protein